MRSTIVPVRFAATLIATMIMASAVLVIVVHHSDSAGRFWGFRPKMELVEKSATAPPGARGARLSDVPATRLIAVVFLSDSSGRVGQAAGAFDEIDAQKTKIPHSSWTTSPDQPGARRCLA